MTHFMETDQYRRIERVVEVKRKVRAILFNRRTWYVGVDVCKVLGLSTYADGRSYHSHFRRLSPGERMTLPENLGGQAQARVLVDESGLHTLVAIALEREAKGIFPKAQPASPSVPQQPPWEINP